ncbi:MAG: nucleotide exchange factor GrpE [Pseudomonadota bacterium]
MSHKNRTKVDELRDALKKKQEPPAGPAAPEAAERKAAEPEDELTRQILAAEEEAKGHYDKLLRVMAEFENFKKRMAREREEQFKYSNEKLLTELLPALDDLDRVLDHVPPAASDETRAIAEGVDMVRKSLLSVLERFGLKEVPAAGEAFDPSRHEAIAMVESEAMEPGKVASVHRRGYWLGDRLLRPAMVTVAKGDQ